MHGGIGNRTLNSSELNAADVAEEAVAILRLHATPARGRIALLAALAALDNAAGSPTKNRHHLASHHLVSAYAEGAALDACFARV